jgi:hypothetical protein
MFKIEFPVMLPRPPISTDFRPFGCQIGCQNFGDVDTPSRGFILHQIVKAGPHVRTDPPFHGLQK